MPTRSEWRKFHFKKDDGVLKSLEYLVHTTIIEPALDEYTKIEANNFNLTEQLGERLANILTCLEGDVKRIEVDITKPILPNQMNLKDQPSIGDDFECLIREIVYDVLKKHALIGAN